MKRRVLLLSFCIFHFTFFTSHSLPAFPGAEGFGSQTPGGRGGRVILVTNTNSTGTGSLYSALTATGPRIIVFRTSGVINLQPGAQWYFEAENLSYMTLAGQTSPGGITITASDGHNTIGQYSSNKTHDLVWRFLRFRGMGDNEHAITHYLCHDFIMDHCDFSGGTDEIVDLAECHDYTVQWSVIANDLHGSGSWGGMLLSTYGTNNMHSVTVHHVLIADDFYRAPAFILHAATISGCQIDIRNNIMYNIPANGHTLVFQYDNAAWPTVHFNLVGNYSKDGPQSVTNSAFPPFLFDGGAEVYEQDNVWDSPRKATWTSSHPGDTVFDTRYRPVLPRSATPYGTPAVTTTSAKQAYQDVLNKVGAWPRDSMTRRNVADVRNGTGTMYNVSDPLITSGPAAPDDADMDGMPDCWETYMGLNPNDAADNILDQDGDGYTNIEEYINDLALCLTGGVPQNGYLESGCPTAVETGRAKAAAALEITASPNPFRTAVKIAVSGQRIADSKIRIAVYNTNGKIIRRLSATSYQLSAGITLDNRDLPAGVYIARITIDGRSLNKRLFLIR